MKNTGLALFVLLGLASTGVAIICYECNSATNSYCSQEVPPASLQRNCSARDRGPPHTLCRKLVQHVDYGVNGQLPASRVVRSCGWDESKYKGVCYSRAGYGGRQEVCSCSTDLCNGSWGLLASRGLVMTSLAIFTRRELFK